MIVSYVIYHCGIAHNMQQPKNSIIEGYVFFENQVKVLRKWH